MELVRVVGMCTSGACPTVYRLEDGDYAVQGDAIVDPPLEGGLPPGEAMVRLPKALMARMMVELPRGK